MPSLISFSVVYNYDRTGNLRTDGTASVLIRAYQKGRYSYFNTGVYIKPEHWCPKQRIVKEHSRSRRLNGTIKEKLHRLEQVESAIAHQTGSCNLLQLKRQADQKTELNFISFFERELERERNRIAPSSYINFKQTLKYLQAYDSNLAFNQISKATVQDFKHFLFNKGLSHNTVQKHYRFFRKYVRLAVQHQLITNKDNPFEGMTMGYKKPDMVYLTEEEFQDFRNYIPPADKPLWQHVHQCFLFCCYTGLRFSDLCQLTSHNFHETEDGYFLRIEAIRKTGKPYLQNIRLLFNSNVAQASPPETIVKQWIAAPQYESGKKLCQIPYRNANSYRRILKLIAEKLGFREIVQNKIATHTARHTFGTYLSSRVGIIVLQDLMGHSDIKETMIYVHLSNKRKRDALLNTKW